MAEINGVGRVGIRSYVAPVSLSSIVTSGLILNLDAGNPLSYSGTGTTWTDLSGNGNNATLYNGTSYSSANGGTMVFDGVNDYAKTTNNTNIIGDANYTISTWVKFIELGGGYRGIAMMGNVNASAGNAIGLMMVGGGNMIVPFYQAVASSVSNTFSINTWYNMTLTKSSGVVNSSTFKLYVNGNLVTISYPNLTPSLLNSQFYIGTDQANEISNNINVGSVLLYNKTLSATEVLQNFDATKARFGFVSYTTRTTAFAAATGITDTTILNALNTFDTGLISNGLATKMKALYPFVGGTATTHKFNFMDARDLDVAFRLQFMGGITHDTNGALGNGVNGSGNTFLNPFTTLTNSNLHLSWYSRTASTVGAYSSEMTPDMAYGVGSNWVSIRVNNKSAGNACFSAGFDGGGSTVAAIITNNGFFLGSETSSNLRKIYKNGTLSATNTVNDTNSLSNTNLNFWGGTSHNYSANNCAFASIGSGLTDGEATTLYNLVQAMQTSLSRAV